MRRVSSLDYASGLVEMSRCETYRFYLSRIWDKGRPSVNFVMLNPSTADAFTDDPTIRRCVGYARAWGYGELVVTNLYPFRSSSPAEMLASPVRRGPDESRGGRRRNDGHLQRAASAAALILCAWGNHAEPEAVRQALALFRRLGKAPHVLKLTKGGNPHHPVRLPSGLVPIEWRPKEGA